MRSHDNKRGHPIQALDTNGQTIDLEADPITKKLKVDGGGIAVTSDLNSTIIPLNSGGTYIGQFELNNYTDVGISCQTDKGGVLYFDFSPDGTNVNTFPVNGFTIAAGIHEFHTAVKLNRYFRVRLVNTDVGNQTYLRLYTYYGGFRQGNLPIGSTINDDSDCIIVREPYNLIDIAREKVESVANFSKFGDIQGLTTALEVISTGGLYQTPTTAQSLEILSSDANDTSAGSGGRKVVVVGLDVNWVEQTEEVAMDGTTPVVLSNTFLRVYRLYVSETGAYATPIVGSHVGTITLRGIGAGVTWGAIPLLSGFPTGQSQICAFTVPVGKSLFLKSLEMSTDATKTVSLYLFKRENADDVSTPYSGVMRLVRHYEKIENTIIVALEGLSVFPEKTDIGIMGLTSTSTANVSCSFNGFLFDN